MNLTCADRFTLTLSINGHLLRRGVDPPTISLDLNVVRFTSFRKKGSAMFRSELRLPFIGLLDILFSTFEEGECFAPPPSHWEGRLKFHVFGFR